MQSAASGRKSGAFLQRTLASPSRPSCQVDLGKIYQRENYYQKQNILLITAFSYDIHIWALNKGS